LEEERRRRRRRRRGGSKVSKTDVKERKRMNRFSFFFFLPFLVLNKRKNSARPSKWPKFVPI
jgi:hypothetical protein